MRIAAVATEFAGHTKTPNNHRTLWPRVVVSSLPEIRLHRKTGCACGGDCPRCQEESPLQKIQTKLTISTPGDQYEQEADAVADQVMRMPDPTMATPVTPSPQASPSLVQRKCSSCAGSPPNHKLSEPGFSAKPSFADNFNVVPNSITEYLVQSGSERGPPNHTPALNQPALWKSPVDQMEDHAVPANRAEDFYPAAPANHQPLLGRMVQDETVPDQQGASSIVAPAIHQPIGGQTLPAAVRAFMEPRFGADFGEVRLHTGPHAAELTSQLQAQAFTYGCDIWLGAGESASDLPLVAHELTHILQQNPSLSRRTHSSAPLAQHEVSLQPMVQRANDYWAPRSLSRFTLG